MKKTFSILIVASNRSEADSWQQAIADQLKATILVAGSLNQADQWIKTNHFDLIVTDYILPDGYGTHFLEEQDEFGNVLLPVLILLDSFKKSLAKTCFQAGALDVYGKEELIPALWPRMVYQSERFWKLTTLSRRNESALRECRTRLDAQVEKRTTDLKKYVEKLQQESEERQLVVEALRESEVMYRTLFESAPVGIALAYINGEVFGTNEAMIRMAGYEDEKHRDSLNLVDLFLDPVEYHNLLIRLHEKENIRDMEVTCKRRNGSVFHAIISFTHLSMSGDEFLLSVFQDISERKRAEEKLQLYASQLKEVNAELYQYDYAVAHDIRAPLRAIRNYADFLLEDLEGKLEGSQEEYLHYLGNAVTEAEQFASDLLELSRIGRKTTGIETIETGRYLNDLVNSLHFPQDVRIEMGDAWPQIQVEPTLLRQVFLNLITNAVKFNDKEDKQVELGCQLVDDHHYEFFVRDNGIGIDEKYHAKIFNVFERLHTAQEYEGTGIGLAIVKKAVNRMQGQLRLESIFGEGTTFFVTLPDQPKEEGE